MIKLTDFLRGFKTGMQDFGHMLTLISNSILLLIVYFVGIGISSIFAKLLGKNFFEIRLSKEKNTYWHELDLKGKPIDNYYKQF